MSHYLGVDWAAMCLTFAAIYLLGNRSRAGFLIMMSGNLLWCVIGIWAQKLCHAYCEPWVFLHERPRLHQMDEVAERYRLDARTCGESV